MGIAPGLRPTCQHEPSSRHRVNRPRRLPALLPLAALTLLIAGISGCHPGPSPAERAQQARLAEQRRQQLRCQQLSRQLQPLQQRFRAAKGQLQRFDAVAYVPSAAPKPLDPEEQSRLTIYDQQTEQEIYDTAVESWRQREAERRGVWSAERAAARQPLQSELNAAAAALRPLEAERRRLPGCAAEPAA